MIGAALELGAARRGIDLGPSAIRYAGLAERTPTLGREVIDLVEADGLKPFAEPSACVAPPDRRGKGGLAPLLLRTRIC